MIFKGQKVISFALSLASLDCGTAKGKYFENNVRDKSVYLPVPRVVNFSSLNLSQH